jgi:hypothetical protein
MAGEAACSDQLFKIRSQLWSKPFSLLSFLCSLSSFYPFVPPFVSVNRIRLSLIPIQQSQSAISNQQSAIFNPKFPLSFRGKIVKSDFNSMTAFSYQLSAIPTVPLIVHCSFSPLSRSNLSPKGIPTGQIRPVPEGTGFGAGPEMGLVKTIRFFSKRVSNTYQSAISNPQFSVPYSFLLSFLRKESLFHNQQSSIINSQLLSLLPQS